MSTVDVVYRREQLFAEVWAEPMQHVAKRYGVTGTALKKTCRTRPPSRSIRQHGHG
jgi:hypothetical protein